MSKQLLLVIMYILITLDCTAKESHENKYLSGEILIRFAPKTNGGQRNAHEKTQILESVNCGKIKHSRILI